jgi:hypothetical protein
MTFMGCLIYSARESFQESAYNLILLPVFFFLIVDIFLVALTHFSISFNEYSYSMFIAIQFIFITAPLLLSAFLSAVLADDYEEFDLQTTFTFLYFLMTFFFCRPRFVYLLTLHKHSSKVVIIPHKGQMIPQSILGIVYVIPVVISFLLQFSLHHNVLTSERHRVIGVIQSILLPVMLMVFCYQKHQRQLEELQVADGQKVDSSNLVFGNAFLDKKTQKRIVQLFQRLLVGLYTLLFIEHPFFDEIKNFSALSYSITNHVIVLMICMVFIFMNLIEKIHSYQEASMSLVGEDDEDENYYRNPSSSSSSASTSFISSFSSFFNLKKHDSWLFLLRIALDFSVGLFVLLGSLLFKIPQFIIPINIISGIVLIELHFFHSSRDTPLFNKVLLIVILFLSVTVNIITFTKGTFYYIVYSFSSYYFSSFQLKGFSHFMAFVTGFAVMLPVFLVIKSEKKGRGKRGRSGLIDSLDGSKEEGAEEDEDMFSLPSFLFSVGFLLFVMIISWTELTLIEQVIKEIHSYNFLFDSFSFLLLF